MIIGFDSKRLFHNSTGLGYYSRTLVHSLVETIPDFKAMLFDAHPVKTELTDKYFSNEKVTVATIGSPGWYSRSVNMDPYLLRHQIEVFHGLSNELPLTGDTKKIPRVVTIHDILFKSFKQDFPWHDRLIYDRKTKSAIQKADIIVAISQATKNDLIQYYKAAEEKIRIIYQSYDPIFNIPVEEAELAEVLSTFELPKTYLLYVGSITHRKNLKVIIDALWMLPAKDRIPLVVAGQGTGYEKFIRQYIVQRQLQNIIHFLPGLPRMTLRILYSGAHLLIYPSLGEGFGLPVLEGIASHIPVITSDRSSMPEAGGDIANYFDPSQPEQLASMIRQSPFGDANSKVPTARTIHLEKFNRNKIALQYLDEVYRPLSR